MKLLPLPREKRRLLEPLGRAALTCLLTAGSFEGPVRPAASGHHGGGRAGTAGPVLRAGLRTGGRFCFCRFRRVCGSWRRPF